MDKSTVLRSLSKAFAKHRKKNGSYRYGDDLKKQTLQAFEKGCSFGEIMEAASISPTCLVKWRKNAVRTPMPEAVNAIQVMEVEEGSRQPASITSPVYVLRFKDMSVEVYPPK